MSMKCHMYHWSWNAWKSMHVWNVSVLTVLKVFTQGFCLYAEAISASSVCFVPWLLLILTWSGGCPVTSGTSSVQWWLLLQSLAGSWSVVLLVCLGAALLDTGVCLGLVLLVSDSSCWCGESTMTSAGLSDASVLDFLDLLSLDIRRGINRKLSVLTWGILVMCLRAVSL